MDWDEVKKLYIRALEDFEELERNKATCLLGTPASLAKKIFEDRFSYAVEHQIGDPSAIGKEIFKHASSVILDCAERSASKIADRMILKEAGKNCYAKWTWSPIKGKCYLTTYNPLEAEPPFKTGKIEEYEIKCPKEEEQYVEANITAIKGMGEKKISDKCLLEAENIISDAEIKDGTIIVKKLWNKADLIDRLIKRYKDRWEEI